MSSVGYYFRPFESIVAAEGDVILSLRDVHPNDFYPLSHLDYASAIKRYKAGEPVLPGPNAAG